MSTIQIIQLTLSCFDHRVLDKTVADVVRVITMTGAKMKGPVPIPTRVLRWTLNRSTHVHKKSREKISIGFHKRLIYLDNPSPQTMEALGSLSLSFAVDITMKILKRG